MKQVRIENPGQIVLREEEMPKPKKGEALLKIRYAGICGSDLNNYKGAFLYSTYPRVPGHEFSAEVVEVEKNVWGIEAGMLVTGNPYYNCGSCYSCQKGYTNCCMDNQTLGAQRDGVFQEYFTMPVERLCSGKGLTAKQLAVIEPFCIGYHAVQRAAVASKDNVFIAGAGPIGILAMMAAKQRGAKAYISDVSENRLKRAEALGADGTWNPGTEMLENFVKRVTGVQGFDVCLECVGFADTFLNCIDAAAYRGRVVVVGVGKNPAEFHFSLLQKKELDLMGSRNAQKQDFEELIDRIDQGVFHIDQLITNIYPCEESDKAFELLKYHQDEMLKVLIEFSK